MSAVVSGGVVAGRNFPNSKSRRFSAASIWRGANSSTSFVTTALYRVPRVVECFPRIREYLGAWDHPKHHHIDRAAARRGPRSAGAGATRSSVCSARPDSSLLAKSYLLGLNV